MFRMFATAALASVFFMNPVFAKDGIRAITRLPNLKGTPIVLIISTIPDEITAVDCQDWELIGNNSWKHHNDRTIPAAKPNTIVIVSLNADKFQGYCKGPRDIVAHTDNGDYIGTLDAGPGNWEGSTTLTFKPASD